MMAQTPPISPEDAVRLARAGEKLLRVDQAAAMAGVSRRSIYNWLERGKVRWMRTAGGTVRIPASDLFSRRRDAQP